MKRGEELMREWDTARAAIAAGNKSSWPRDWFESVIDVRDERIAELEAAVRAALNMVDGNGVPPNWDWMRAVLAGKSADYFAKLERTE